LAYFCDAQLAVFYSSVGSNGSITQKDKGMVPYRIVPAGSVSGWRASTVLAAIKRS
jgi:hypothetical protein